MSRKFAKPEQQIYDRMKGRVVDVVESISPSSVKKVEKLLKKIGMDETDTTVFLDTVSRFGMEKGVAKFLKASSMAKYKKYDSELELVAISLGF